jgi:signal recognition particle subunit SRP54
MFESLSQKLDRAFKNIRGQGKLTEKNMKDSLQEIRTALLEADVNYKVVKQFIADVQEEALGQQVFDSVQPGQQIVKIVHDELQKLMGGANEPLKMASNPPTIIMMVGLQGRVKRPRPASSRCISRKRATSPCSSVRTYTALRPFNSWRSSRNRPASRVSASAPEADPVDTCLMARGEAQRLNCDVILLDTAGRLHVDEQMMGEVRRIQSQVSPHEVLFVASAMTGQDAVNSAKQFNDALPLTGVILTQMDGDARGGAAISLISVTGCPIKFVGTGEKLEALDAFHPRRMADQILGMGDIVSFVEKAQEVVDQEKALKFQEKAKKGTLDLEMFLDQLQQMKKLGGLGEIASKIPGFSKMMGGQTDIDEDELKYTEAIIYSMTPKERRNPKIINGSRRRRIADGSGTTVQEVNRLLKEFEKQKRMMKQLMKGKGPFGKGPKGGRGIMRMPGM